MKYRYDWAEIKHASDLWCYQLIRMDEVFQGDNPVIDTAHIRYIREIMDRHPKLERLMPYEIELRPYKNWSGKPGSNWRPQPWQGCALPTELFPLLSWIIYIQGNMHSSLKRLIFSSF